MKKLNLKLLALLVLFSLLFISFAFWLFKPAQKLNIFILDKTVADNTYREHAAFVWILNAGKIQKPNKQPYSVSKDYYGFLPKEPNSKEQYKIRSIRLFEVLTLSDQLDMAYYTDNYGVFSSDISNPGVNIKPYLIYGGLNQNDYLLLREMKRKNKLIITEFNLLGSPTSPLIREKTEDLFDFRWTGWTGRYFRSLNNISQNEIPSWIVTSYQKQYQKSWTFTEPGIVLINETGTILVLEQGRDLDDALPEIVTSAELQKSFDLPASQKYGFWFDIIQTTKINKIQAVFKLNVKDKGNNQLKANNIPSVFPAIIEHTQGYKFYYFSGDFAEYTPRKILSYFGGVASFMNKINTGTKGTSSEFFWNFYVPLMNGILEKNFPKN